MRHPPEVRASSNQPTWFTAAAFLICFQIANGVTAEPPPLLAPLNSPVHAASTASGATEDVPASGVGASKLVQALLLKNLPREYENAKNWGQTRRRWNGLDVSFDGLRVDTKRRWKEVNHGSWTRYRAWLINPENELQIHFVNPRRAGSHATAFDLIVDAHIGATGRLSEWNRGVQLYSLSADAEGKVRMQVACEIGLQLDVKHFPPDVLVAPKVTDAKLDLLEFRLHRISQADGPLVHKLGDSLRNDINRELNDRRGKLVEKLNRAIDKNKDHLRLSLHAIAEEKLTWLVPEAAGGQ